MSYSSEASGSDFVSTTGTLPVCLHPFQPPLSKRKPAAETEKPRAAPPLLAAPEQPAATVPLRGQKTDAEFLDETMGRAFSFETPPKAPTVVFRINGKPVSHGGNLTSIIAQIKSGKSSVVAAMIAAVIVGESTDRGHEDTLGITAGPRLGRCLLHIDTEQSRYDHDSLVRSALRRANAKTMPEWVRSYGLVGYSAAELRRALRLLLAAAAPQGIFAVLIDGIGDFVSDVNDPVACNELVADLHRYAYEFDCVFVIVIHENPGKEGGKARGHLGSELLRKGESNLRLKKCDGVTTLFGEQMRHAPIPEKDGTRFVWDEDFDMHRTCTSAPINQAPRHRAKADEMARQVFQGKAEMTWTEVRDGIARVSGLTASGAAKRLDGMVRLGAVERAGIGWRLPATEEPFRSCTNGVAP